MMQCLFRDGFAACDYLEITDAPRDLRNTEHPLAEWSSRITGCPSRPPRRRRSLRSAIALFPSLGYGFGARATHRHMHAQVASQRAGSWHSKRGAFHNNGASIPGQAMTKPRCDRPFDRMLIARIGPVLVASRML